jgi:putative aldouronate transport system substrate-binding protein
VHEVRAFVNKPWLDKLGLAVPRTTDELYEVLKAFKTRDPNGNGKADEIPMSGAITRGGYNNEIDKWLMNAFVYSYFEDRGDRSFVHVENKKVFFAAGTPQWREGLRYMRMLYRDKLVDPEIFTQARDPGLKQKSETPGAQILGFVPSGSISAFNIYYGDSGRYKEWVLVPPLKGPAGYQVSYTGPYRILPGFEITSAARRPDVIMRWADWFYTKEGTLAVMNGEEGVAWRRGQANELGANGKPAVFARLVPYGRKQDYAWASTSIHDQSIDIFNGLAVTRPDDQGPILYNAANLYDQYRPREFLPYLWYDQKDSAEMAELALAIKDYVVAADAAFITDRKNLDGPDWDEYLKELDKLGVKRYVELTQKAYDAYLAVQ